jgi:hypothetical protein
MDKGHMHWHCSNTASTRNAQSGIIAAHEEVDHMLPMQEAYVVHNMVCYAALGDATTGTMYTDLTGTLPVWSFRNMQYIFVA